MFITEIINGLPTKKQQELLDAVNKEDFNNPDLILDIFDNFDEDKKTKAKKLIEANKENITAIIDNSDLDSDQKEIIITLLKKFGWTEEE